MPTRNAADMIRSSPMFSGLSDGEAGALTFVLAIGAPISRLGRRYMAPPATGPAHSSA